MAAPSAGPVGSAADTVLAFPVAWLVARAARGAVSRSWLATAVERSTYVSSSLPGVVIALALVTVSVRYCHAVYQTALVLVLAYTILFIPRAMVTIRASIALVPPELGEAARSLGQSPARTFWRVLLPLTLRGALAGFALVFIAVTTELTATLILSPIGTHDALDGVLERQRALDYAAAAPYALAMVLLSAPLTWLLMRGPDGRTTRASSTSAPDRGASPSWPLCASSWCSRRVKTLRVTGVTASLGGREILHGIDLEVPAGTTR